MNETTRTSPALLTLAGLVSGALTTLVVSSRANLGIGLVFGLALIVYFRGFEKQRSSLRQALFLCICTLAWPASILSGFEALVIDQARALPGSQHLRIPLPAFFVGSVTGGLLILGTAVVFFGQRPVSRRTLKLILLYSIGCGILAVTAAALIRNQALASHYDMMFLLLVWQPGTALLLGVLIRQVRQMHLTEISVATGRSSGSVVVKIPRLIAGVFLACCAGLFGFWVLHIFQVEREGAGSLDAGRRYAAAAPSSENLAPIEPQAMERVLILDEIDGLYPSLPVAWPPGKMQRQYSVDYTAVKDPPTATFVQRIVRVEVVQVPNEIWAQYRAKNPRFNVAVVAPESLSIVRRFGQTVMQDSYGNVCFHWPSGSFVVSVCFDTPQIREEFLKRYLEKYPSSYVTLSRLL